MQSAKLTVDKDRLLNSPETELILQFKPFDYRPKPVKPDIPGDEEFKTYEKMLNKMYLRA